MPAMLGSRLRFSLLLLGLCLTTPAWAWNAAGHRIVAAIAWEELSPAARQQIADLLAAHPDHERWRKHGPEDPGRTAFIEAGCWPDEIRRDPRFYDEEENAPTPPFPGMADTARHRRWHYLDLPLHGGKNTGKGELQRQLPRLLAALGNRTDEHERLYALPWVIHLIADVHQPLHVASQAGEGGTQHFIADPFSSRLPENNLHRWWDDLPGPPWLRGRYLDRTVARSLRAHPEAVAAGNLASWIEESREIARQFAYPAVSDEIPVITATFKQDAERITRQRLVVAGKRLAQVLEAAFSVPRETP